MNIILIENQELNGDEVVLEDHRASHIVKILRSEEGDTLKFGVIEGMRGEAEIVSIKGNTLTGLYCVLPYRSRRGRDQRLISFLHCLGQ